MDLELFLRQFISKSGKNILISALIISIGIFLVNKMNKIFTIFCKNIKIESSEFNFFNWGMKTLIYFTMFSLVISQFEIKIWSTIASLSASIVAISVIFKDNVTNFISGFYILLNKLIHINDIIQVGTAKGRVVKIGALCTYLVTDDKKTVIIPNGKIISDIIVRESEWDISSISFSIIINDANSEITKKEQRNIKTKIEKYIALGDKYISNDPPPNLSFDFSNGVICKVSAYVYKSNIDKFKSSLLQFANEEFKNRNVEITYNEESHN